MLLLRDSWHEEGNPLSSDKGTNFVGAASEMREWIETWNQSGIEQSLAQKQIKWKFNPQNAPHFGGVSEPSVRSSKKAMTAIVRNRTPTGDVLSLTMCIVEQILNSRPLFSVSDDPEDLEALTPNHFLLGRASPATPFNPDAQRYTDLTRVFRKTSIETGTLVLRKCCSGEKQGRQCWRQSIARSKTPIRT